MRPPRLRALLPPSPQSRCTAPTGLFRRSLSSSTSNSTSPPPLPTALSHPPASAFFVSPGYGQPLPLTHPHLLSPGELTPGISAAEYEARRSKLMSELEEGTVVVVAGGRMKYLSGNIFYKFRQSTNFWYLTGWEEPDSVLVLERKSSSHRGYEMTLFCPSKDLNDEVWNGPRSGREGAIEIFGADHASDISLLSNRLTSILSNSSSPIYVDAPNVSPTTRVPRRRSRSLLDYLVPNSIHQSEFETLTELLEGQKTRTIKSAAKIVEKLRLIKSDAEIVIMRKAADISSAAHAKVMRFAAPTSVSGLTESSLVSHFEYCTSLRGSPRPAYVPVCASGPAGLTIHYTRNSLPLLPSTLVVLDAGCEYGGYASDITRTFPVSGTFTSPQRDLYEAVLRVQKECVGLCSEDAGMSLDDLHRRSTSRLAEELRDLGFSLRGNELERVLYPHYVGHQLGIDLHDTNSFERNRPIKVGMVITIEPGVCVPPHPNFPKEFHNLTIRLEDEVLVRKDDFVVLSVDAPKERVDVEACCLGLLEA